MLLVGYIMFLNTDYLSNQLIRYYLGWCAIFLGFALYVANFLVMLGIFLVELHHAYRMYTIRRKFILAYGRREMIEENYFKTSRDSGFRGSNSSGFSLKRGASRDNYSPGKKRRSRTSKKSSLVQKNDTDDVYEVGFDSSPSSEKTPSTSKFLKNLRGRAGARTMDAIEERVDESEYSDYDVDDRYTLKKQRTQDPTPPPING